MLAIQSWTFKVLAKTMLPIACFLVLLPSKNHLSEAIFSPSTSEEITAESENNVFDVSIEEWEEIEASQVFKRLHVLWIQHDPLLCFLCSEINTIFQRQIITMGWLIICMTNAP